ncbi:glycosyl transferase group 1 [Halothece sp. PCC 7418]|uniref:glycosyltransferase family 4 protein n=1 Tax=Halothece sp. (strain PCC 7418) TaxID=65093 RepID=UPI0002A067BD|nr:glycosyltransferase family 4 protein [Halothece sp. PCC 7418]AFZ44938.1 glycosyl transferase group 1 [Halothece sp. PCC 7418]
MVTESFPSKEHSSWICCQIGAREHYAIPISLHQEGQLIHLITDAWVSPHSELNYLPRVSANLRGRYHSELADAKVSAFNYSLIAFELSQRLRGISGWQCTIARNNWFQKKAKAVLKKIANQLSEPPVIFSYSYAALEIFRFAKEQGWTTVLGQIDPGIREEELVIAEHERHPDLAPEWKPAPPHYWDNWREECQLADHIVVNSEWSRQLLQEAGIETEKCKIIPLVYTPPAEALNFVRTYPDTFSPERPLRVLFLGQVILRKGMAAVLEAIQSLEGYPIEFWIVGSCQINIPEDIQNHPQVHWIGRIPRSKTAYYYQQADVFLFPTLSDGFGLTQLEAQAWQLPIIASQNCGKVVTDGENGWILSEVTGGAIAACLKHLLSYPFHLRHYSQNSSFLVSKEQNCSK